MVVLRRVVGWRLGSPSHVGRHGRRHVVVLGHAALEGCRVGGRRATFTLLGRTGVANGHGRVMVLGARLPAVTHGSGSTGGCARACHGRLDDSGALAVLGRWASEGGRGR